MLYAPNTMVIPTPFVLSFFFLSFSILPQKICWDVQSQTHVIMFDDVSFYIHMENKRGYKCLAIVGYLDNVTGLGKGSWIYALKHMAHPTHLAIVAQLLCMKQ